MKITSVAIWAILFSSLLVWSGCGGEETSLEETTVPEVTDVLDTTADPEELTP